MDGFPVVELEPMSSQYRFPSVSGQPVLGQLRTSAFVAGDGIRPTHRPRRPQSAASTCHPHPSSQAINTAVDYRFSVHPATSNLDGGGQGRIYMRMPSDGRAGCRVQRGNAGNGRGRARFTAPRNHRSVQGHHQQPRLLDYAAASQDVRNGFVHQDGMSAVYTSRVDATQPTDRGGRKENVAVRVGSQASNAARRVEDKNQRERLVEDLGRDRLECQFCFDYIWARQPIWSCDECYNIFHLKCVRGWAISCKKESPDGTWRCMTCQYIFIDEPRKYLCFCRKVENPEWNGMQIPHSCGQVCGRPSSKACEHTCICLCHPGPHPPCQRLITRQCGCGSTSAQEQCSSTSAFVCSSPCQKPLDCGNHSCLLSCHVGPCPPCENIIEKPCHCLRQVRAVPCAESSTPSFSCDEVCGQKLSCGHHDCSKLCHAGPCVDCVRDPRLVSTCPCGQRQLTSQERFARKTCLDPIPYCKKICGKLLSCGTEKSRHVCESQCHDGECSLCEKKSTISCACRSSTRVVECCELRPDLLNWRCPKRCQKKMLCGRHKCENTCCDYDAHICPKVCGKKLSCGLHTCQDPCGHPGACTRCYNTSFQERSCRCGATVEHPPIPCGAPPVPCTLPCSQPHPCGHPSTHSCADGVLTCPPCTYLCEKICYCGQDIRRSVHCYIAGVSCGKLCGKELLCGVHLCRRTCHSGICQELDATCAQLCTLSNRKCGHECGVTCHGKTLCPITPCKSVVEVTCECKRRKHKLSCAKHEELIKSYLKRHDISTKGAGIDSFRSALPTDVMECDDECRRVDRNAKMAAALQVEEDPAPEWKPVLGSVLYTETLKQFCRDNQKWATATEQSVITLVTNLRELRKTRLVHQFQPMHYEHRKYLHELAEYYGCQTQSYDHEPMRSVS